MVIDKVFLSGRDQFTPTVTGRSYKDHVKQIRVFKQHHGSKHAAKRIAVQGFIIVYTILTLYKWDYLLLNKGNEFWSAGCGVKVTTALVGAVSVADTDNKCFG